VIAADLEDPGAQGRSSLESGQPGEHAGPGVLRHFLRGGAIAHEDERQPHQRLVLGADERDECRLVPGQQADDQRAILVRCRALLRSSTLVARAGGTPQEAHLRKA